MQAPFIDVAGLKQHLTLEKEHVDAWAHSRTESASNISEEHFQTVQQHTETIQDLGEQREQLSKQAEQLQKRLAEETAVVQDLQRRLQEAGVTEAAIPADIDRLQAELQHDFSRVQSREADLAATSAAREADLAALQDQVSRYSSRLGLRLEPRQGLAGQEELRVIFTHIDEAASAREFSFGVHVRDDGVYEERSCEPPIDTLPSLLAALNESPDSFGKFVREMRRAFQNLVAMEAAT